MKQKGACPWHVPHRSKTHLRRVVDAVVAARSVGVGAVRAGGELAKVVAARRAAETSVTLFIVCVAGNVVLPVAVHHKVAADAVGVCLREDTESWKMHTVERTWRFGFHARAHAGDPPLFAIWFPPVCIRILSREAHIVRTVKQSALGAVMTGSMALMEQGEKASLFASPPETAIANMMYLPPLPLAAGEGVGHEPSLRAAIRRGVEASKVARASRLPPRCAALLTGCADGV